jgi:fumarate reductase flavoprotein subunit
MAGLFAAGEAACWDMHGFNRLGGNSLAETLVAGRIVGERVADYVGSTAGGVDTALAFEAIERADSRSADWLARTGEGRTVYDIRDDMGWTMMHKVGIFRDGTELEQALTKLRDLLEEARCIPLRSKAPGMNPELSFALRIEGMLKLAICVTAGALARKESRGAHHRTDFPARDDANWLNRTLVRWSGDTEEPRLSYEPVGLIDLPPGDRGYGKSKISRLAVSLDDYNGTVLERQAVEGRIETEEPMGSRIRAGEWTSAAGEGV